MGDQTQAYDIFQTPLSSGYPLPLKAWVHAENAIYTNFADNTYIKSERQWLLNYFSYVCKL